MAVIVNRQPAEVDVTRAHQLEREVVAGCRAIRQAWILLAGYLHEMQDGRLYRLLDCDSFERWLATPEISLSRSHAYALIGAYTELVVERGLDPELVGAIEASKLAETLPALRAGDVTAEEAIADAESLSRSDLREKYRHDTGQLDAEAEPPVCPACGQRVRGGRQ